MDEVDVETVDLGNELRVQIQPSLDLSPVMFGLPVASELLDRRELHALRCVRNRFALGQPRRGDAPAQFGKFRVRNIHMKWTNSGLITARLLCNVSHSYSPPS